jgi:hypothetical protein
MAVTSVSIGRLVLHGVAPADAAAVRGGMEAELRRLLAGDGLAAARAPRGRLAAAPAADPRAVGAAIARALLAGIAP